MKIRTNFLKCNIEVCFFVFWGVKLSGLGCFWSLINFINDYVRELYNCMNINPCKKSKLDTLVAVLLCFWVVWGGLGCFGVVWGVLGWFGVFPRNFECSKIKLTYQNQ